MTEAQERKVLRLVGLGIRARTAVVGVEQVRRAAGRGRVRLALVALDASAHSRAKLLPLLAARGVSVVELPSAQRLGAAADRASTAAIGVLDSGLARGMMQAIGVAPARASGRDGSVGEKV